jgi:glycosyltransferase involved in cell wall biosynthesis
LLDSSVATIERLPDAEARPVWSVMIPTYNCASFLRQTLESVLAQDPGAATMQIEVVDDCSTRDDPEAVVQEVGASRVAFYRQPRNVGISENFNTCIRRARGEWVHILHGDDYVKPGFYEKLQDELARNPDVGAALVRTAVVNERGSEIEIGNVLERDRGLLRADWAASPWRSWIFWLFVFNPVRTPGVVVRRAVYERLGGFRSDLSHCADWDMWKRIVAGHAIFFETEVLACYRVHQAADTTRLARTGGDIREFLNSVTIAATYPPPQWRLTYDYQIRRWLALWFARRFWKEFELSRLQASFMLVAAAIRCAFGALLRRIRIAARKLS